MSRARLTLIAPGMAFVLPALTGAHGSPEGTSLDPAIGAATSQIDHDDTPWEWRLRPYRHLDSVNAVVDSVLATGGANRVDEHITIPRRDLELIRTHVGWARDAAARIGH